MALKEAELIDYACLKFEEGQYDEALEAFVLAYMKGYEHQWVMETIYNCYMEGNMEEFRKAFHHCANGTGAAFEACTLDFIPYRDGAYYIFDKEGEVFLGKFFVSDFENAEPDPAFEEMEFSGAAVELDWNWEEETSILSAAKERKVYAVCHNWRRAISFFRVPELAEYAKNIMLFSEPAEFQAYFHQNTAVYLPKIVQGGAWAQELSQIINQEHAYRMTPEGRNTDNVLLTIGIPTHDRGNLLLARIYNLCKMPYDSEIEIAISKHGFHYYQNEYKAASEIEDARINYVGTNEELMMPENWRNVVNIANGKFVLVVSDEDDVLLDSLEYYLKYLDNHSGLGAIRTRTIVQYQSLDKAQYYQKGEEAFLGGFLNQNYLSGIIYNKKIFDSAGLEIWDQKYKDNSFYYLYPHMWWHVALSFLGDYAIDNHYLIVEGDSVWKEETAKYEQDGLEDSHGATKEKPDIIDIVSSFKARLEQFKGAVLLINDCEKFDAKLKAKAYEMLIDKTLYLMIMVHDYYSKTELLSWIERFVDEVIISVKTLQIDPEREKTVLKNMESKLSYLENYFL